MVAVRPKFSQHRFDHMRSLIHKIRDRALTRNDFDTQLNAELLDALLLVFVEDLILDGSINVPFVGHS
jgi:hypothetical protein